MHVPKVLFHVMKRSVIWIILCLGLNQTNGKPTQGKKMSGILSQNTFSATFVSLIKGSIYIQGIHFYADLREILHIPCFNKKEMQSVFHECLYFCGGKCNNCVVQRVCVLSY